MTMELSIHNVSVARQEKTIFSSLNFTAYAGDIVCVTGKNGSGKTTLLRCLCGLLPYQNGQICLSHNTGRYVQHTDSQWGRYVSFLGSKNPLYEHYSAQENIDIWCRYWQLPRLSSQEKERKLDEADLTKQRDTPIHYFSSGQKRRLSLVLVSLTYNSVYLLDEPDIMLDSCGQAYLQNLLTTLSERHVITFISTHHSKSIPSNQTLNLDEVSRHHCTHVSVTPS